MSAAGRKGRIDRNYLPLLRHQAAVRAAPGSRCLILTMVPNDHDGQMPIKVAIAVVCECSACSIMLRRRRSKGFRACTISMQRLAEGNAAEHTWVCMRCGRNFPG